MRLPAVWDESLKGFCGQELQREAARRFRKFELPDDLSGWNPELLRQKIWNAFGVGIDHSVDLDFHVTGEIRRVGYRIQKIYYQSRPGFYVTGNLYIPDGKGPFPAVINLHGHWSQGRLAERVQERGHLFALAGFVCLCVDAFGSGERSDVHGEFVYHGANWGGSLMHYGETLMGIQVVDNMRGVDLLCSLPFVEASRIGATGASGGGNQTMWLAAMDERIAAAAPVVSVGSFESYIMCSNCVCELLPDGLTFAEESAVLALVAPRALMPCNGLLDANPAFQPREMLRSLAGAAKIYRAMGASEKIASFVFNQPHGYWPEVQQAVLGWFRLHLKGEGSGRQVPVPEFKTLPEEEMFVFEKGKRPDFVFGLSCYLAKLAAGWKTKRSFRREDLRSILRLRKMELSSVTEHSERDGFRRFTVAGNDGRLLPMLWRAPKAGKRTVIVSAPFGKKELEKLEWMERLAASGEGLAVIDLWGCGENEAGNTPESRDLNFARSLIWLGQNLQGKWVEDFLLAEEALKQIEPEATVAAAGFRDVGLTALLFAAIRTDPTDVLTCEAPASLEYTPVRAQTFTYSLMLPRILTCADIPELAAAAGGEVRMSASV